MHPSTWKDSPKVFDSFEAFTVIAASRFHSIQILIHPTPTLTLAFMFGNQFDAIGDDIE